MDIQETINFLTGQITLYKIEFVESDNNKYLEVMNEFNKAIETFRKLDGAVNRLAKENRELKTEITKLKEI